jgi:hypothetical protein
MEDNNFKIKIDRVKSLEQALELENLNVNIISIYLKEDVDINLLLELKRNLNYTKIAIEISDNIDLQSIIRTSKPDFIQISNNKHLSSEDIEVLKKFNINIIYSEITASYDDDPSWLILNNNSPFKNYFYQIDFLGDVKNSWNFLKNEVSKYKEELQIKDIIDLGESYPIMISLDFSSENISEIISDLKTIKGFYMTLKSDDLERNDIHYFDYKDVIQILENLKK